MEDLEDMEIKPRAVALPKSTEKLEQGKYGPIFPRTPACYGFTIELRNFEPNPALSQSSFAFIPPPGAQQVAFARPGSRM